MNTFPLVSGILSFLGWGAVILAWLWFILTVIDIIQDNIGRNDET